MLSMRLKIFLDPFLALSSKYDSSSDKLYFHQCFEVISELGSGSFGEVSWIF